MDKVIVVSDTSAISNLIQINRLSILIQLFSEVIIPPAVFSEVMQLEKFGVSVSEFVDAFSKKRMKVMDFVDPLNELTQLTTFLDKGESEAIILASEINADWILIDERLGRKVAYERGLPVIGLLGVLRLAKQGNLILHLKPILDDLRSKAGFWFSDSLYQEILQSVDE